MLVVDLHCAGGHHFEGWFSSSDDLASQQSRGLVTCPVCGGLDVVRRPSAPHLNVAAIRDEGRGHAAARTSAEAGGGEVLGRTVPSQAAVDVSPEKAREAQAVVDTLQAMYLQVAKHVVASTEDVGQDFAETARRIHHGEEPERAIRGQASEDEREALRDEGIEVMSMVIPKGLDGPLQ